ncbi:hypothetical protein IEO21_01546 [Rhodonia placenta]|uniref:Uncharacterized protein n=1 Tax=Rhodonia placenta TaxID=104341 RepID=A0A8H7P9L4_9APHY|nr:hypothetical protein IEO21_01546 [Postia placenta]
MFPVIGSGVLFGLYLVMKYLGTEWINWLLQWYFTLTGVGSVSKVRLTFKLRENADTVPQRAKRCVSTDWTCLSASYIRAEIASISMRTPSWFLIVVATLPSILYTFGPSTTRRSAVLTDILAMSFSHNALSLLKIDSFKTGCVLLSGLFLYDIWWVFGTEVMVKVATNLDVPIKIVWAKSLTFSTERGFTMLGLGDIVVPGMFIALALRYDHHRSSHKAPGSAYAKPYFTAAVFAYVLGLGTTMFVMHYFKKAQPALLYLSPACILSFLLTSAIRGEFSEAWAWSDDPEQKPEDATIKVHGNGTGEAPSTATKGIFNAQASACRCVAGRTPSPTTSN